jgi:hypothetical protein
MWIIKIIGPSGGEFGYYKETTREIEIIFTNKHAEAKRFEDEYEANDQIESLYNYTLRWRNSDLSRKLFGRFLVAVQDEL